MLNPLGSSLQSVIGLDVNMGLVKICFKLERQCHWDKHVLISYILDQVQWNLVITRSLGP